MLKSKTTRGERVKDLREGEVREGFKLRERERVKNLRQLGREG